MPAGEPEGLLEALLSASHLIVPADLPALLAREATRLGVTDLALYLVDYEAQHLHPVPSAGGARRRAVSIDGTLAGRCFQRLAIERAPLDGHRERTWVPMLDGTERLGVLEAVTPVRGHDDPSAGLLAVAALAAEFVVTKSNYGDIFEQVRRQRPMSYSAELIWQLLPPLTFANDQVIITAALAPPYDLGGDAFDYAVDATTAHLAIFDAVGHSLRAGLLATVALAAYRNHRRRRTGLEDTVVAIDRALAEEFTDSSYVTGVVAQLDLASGRLDYCVAGHPRPLLLRNGKIVKTLDGNPAGGPLGVSLTTWPVAREHLEPGDRIVLYTDGVTEARDPDGQFFGDARLADHIVRADAGGAPPPETMRRLIRSILDHQAGVLQDDATAVLVEWQTDNERSLTVEGDPPASG